MIFDGIDDERQLVLKKDSFVVGMRSCMRVYMYVYVYQS